MPDSRVRSLILASTALLASACGSADGEDRDAFTVRDSAGVRIAESGAPASTRHREVRISAQPAREIGTAAGPPAYVFGRLAGAVRTSNGGFVIADRQAAEIRWFDAAGRHLHTAGRRGDGPGEFRGILVMTRARGDTVVAWDAAAHRLTWFAPDGSYAREATVRMPGLDGTTVLAGVLTDGALLFTVAPGPSTSPENADLLRLVHFREPDAWEVRERYPRTSEPSRPITNGSSVLGVMPPPFARRLAVAVTPDGYWTGTGERYEVAHRDPAGNLDRIVRRSAPNPPVTEAEISAYRDARLASAIDAQTRAIEAREVREAVFPRELPAYSDLHASADGHLWVRETPMQLGTPHVWSVFGADGRSLGSVELPAPLVVTQVGADWLVGLWRDELDVASVRLYTVELPGR